MAATNETPLSVSNAVALYGLVAGQSTLHVFGGPTLSASATTADAKAEYPVLTKDTSTTAAVDLFTIEATLPLGLYSVLLRWRSSAITSTDPLVTLTASHVEGATATPLKTATVKPTMWPVVNEYACFGLTVDFKGTKSPTAKLRLAATMPTNATAHTVTIDYVAVSPAATALASLG